MRPNFAQDAPPTEISVGGYAYKCNVDFRVWIDALKLFREFRRNVETEEHARRNVEIAEEIQTMIFGGVLEDEDPAEALSAIIEFSKGYPAAPVNGSSGGTPTYSFEYDLNWIIIAIRNQSGIDLSYRRKEPFHWWEFLLEFQSLCGNHYILNLMDARGYDGKDRELLKRKRMCALPEELSVEEQEELDAFNAQFG